MQGSPIDLIDVSFIVIALNEDQNIQKCIRSILSQDTQLNIEVILVDDGSTDTTGRSASECAAGDSRLRLITNERNLGRGKARTIGLTAANGRDIAFVDADIVLPSDWLTNCLLGIKSHVAVSGIAVPDGDIAPIARITKATPRPIQGSMPITGNNVLFQGAVIRSLGFPGNRQGEDFRLAVRIMKLGFSIKCLEDLKVEHNERKTYVRYLAWMLVSGRDATRLLFENSIVRKADLAWGLWLTTLGLGLAGLIMGNGKLLIGAFALNSLAVLLIVLLHTLTRFELNKATKWIYAFALSFPAILLYLIGRTIGLFGGKK
jgi:glycosyltransferase involved in cell wall biosynthesis